jgi:hypothetical protein
MRYTADECISRVPGRETSRRRTFWHVAKYQVGVTVCYVEGLSSHSNETGVNRSIIKTLDLRQASKNHVQGQHRSLA